MSNNTKTNTPVAALRSVMPDDSMSIVDMLLICLRHWPWFILSLLIIMGAATLYLLRTTPVYTRSMSILVKSQNSSNEKMFDVLGMSDAVSNISDEVIAIHSPAVVYEMVRRLHLDLDYQRSGMFRDETLYGTSLPVEVSFEDLHDNETASFTLSAKGDDQFVLSDMVFNNEKIEKTYRLKLGKLSKTPYGKMTIKPTPSYQKGTSFEIQVRRISFNSAAAIYGGNLSAYLQAGAKNIIVITCNDINTARAENILNTVTNIYNENWIKNRNQISVSTNEFIKERLAVIEQELGDVEGDIADYKSSHGMLSVEQAASQAVGKEAAADAERQQINNQLYMIRYVRNYVADPSHAKQLMPASTGIGNGAIESQIAEYNTRILERNNLVSNSSEQNPLVGDMDVNLGNLRNAILKSLDNAQATLNAQLASVQAIQGAAMSKLSAAPQQENHLLSIERQQKVKESLYLFLLQKREENELSQAFTAYNTRLIASPGGSGYPIFPQKKRILMIAFALAMGLPAAFFILREMSNSTVRGRKDLENLTIPYVGELPLWKPKKGEELPEGYHFVVRQHSRDITNEAYRVVRTNLEFMMNSASAPSAAEGSSSSRVQVVQGSKGSRSKIKDSGAPLTDNRSPLTDNRSPLTANRSPLTDNPGAIIMLTSFNPGSGKTFITANLGASFAIRNSRVICIDLDLRRGSLSDFAGKPKKGLTNYLSGQLENYQDIIVHIDMKGTKGSTSGAGSTSSKGSSSSSSSSSSGVSGVPESSKGSSVNENPTPGLNPEPLTLNHEPAPAGPQLDILPIGKIPPNPTELLYSPKLKPMLDDLRQHYDYIFVDCPPVEIVADATIISHESDLTIFVIRAGLLDRSMLPELQKNYDEKKYNNMAMLLNGTDAEHHYGYHRYGYGYGRYGYGRYGYGKRYGYGYYGYGSKKS